MVKRFLNPIENFEIAGSENICIKKYALKCGDQE